MQAGAQAARLVAGSRVRINGLSRTDLNERVATLKQFDESAGRWLVAIEGVAEPRLLRSENLTAC